MTRAPRTLLFWIAFVLTRPLGATLGDWLTKPHDHGGLAASRVFSSALLAVAMVALVALSRQPPDEGDAHRR